MEDQGIGRQGGGCEALWARALGWKERAVVGAVGGLLITCVMFGNSDASWNLFVGSTLLNMVGFAALFAVLTRNDR